MSDTPICEKCGFPSFVAHHENDCIGLLKGELAARRVESERLRAQNAALHNRLSPSLEYVENIAVGYGEDEIDRLDAEIKRLREFAETMHKEASELPMYGWDNLYWFEGNDECEIKSYNGNVTALRAALDAYRKAYPNE